MLPFVGILHVLLSFLPAWFEITLMIVFAFMFVVIILKLVAFVMDLIPFV